jgi:hypothetical protein
MDPNEARRVIESLRKGIPPDGFVRDFTVGRREEIKELQRRLSDADGTALLLKANYGAGKSHLIRFIREEALEQRFAVSVVTLDSSSAVRFNRMDQVFGAICRNIEVPKKSNTRGIRCLLDVLKNQISDRTEGPFWNDLSNGWKWNYSEHLDSPALFVAVRAWATGNVEACDLIEDWLLNPWQYKRQRKKLYCHLVENMRKHFRDPRPEWKFYADEVFMFHTGGYAQSWAALRDLERLACAVGLKGLVILFDEFEDVITNLRNVAHQEAAFWNLFHFYSGKQFPGKTFYAVTPEFVEKCKIRLLKKGRWDMDLSMFDALPKFEMSPLSRPHLFSLGEKIVDVHRLAYEWNGQFSVGRDDLETWMKEATAVQLQDRTRQAITLMVKRLDSLFQDAE